MTFLRVKSPSLLLHEHIADGFGLLISLAIHELRRLLYCHSKTGDTLVVKTDKTDFSQ